MNNFRKNYSSNLENRDFRSSLKRRKTHKRRDLNNILVQIVKKTNWKLGLKHSAEIDLN